jgi:cysteine desulfurase
MEKPDFIYLDYAAATPVDARVFEAMKPFFSENFFNPSASYLPAKHVRKIYEDAKDELAHTIGAKGNDLVITAGATEANNLAFSAVNDSEVLVLETEHASVLNLAKKYDYKTVKVDKNGRIDLVDFKNKLTSNVGFVSISLCNNELGTIQPISDIVELINEERKNRVISGNQLQIIFHSDASQALNLMDISVSRLGVDLLTINSAKVYGPKGVGALYVGRGIKLKPVVYGGGQESGLRSGTENVAGLIGFSTAAKIAKEHVNGNRKKFEKLNKIFKETLLKNLDGKIEPKFLGNEKRQLSNFVPVCFDGLDAERLIFKLEDEGIYVSTGAACAASKGEKSHVLTAIGLTDSEIAGSLRISMGKMNDEENVKLAAEKLAEIVKKELERIHG